ncbi:hypothetical protein [Nocardia asiatica]|uniref:hypothetical protein n=1 Tax=Nocardia asiatica TaxID=209252 RepID=UPI003EDF6D43
MRTAERDDYLTIDSNQLGRSRRESFDADRQVEAVVVRHPDGSVDVHIFIDGVETAVTDFTMMQALGGAGRTGSTAETGTSRLLLPQLGKPC